MYDLPVAFDKMYTSIILWWRWSLQTFSFNIHLNFIALSITDDCSANHDLQHIHFQQPMGWDKVQTIAVFPWAISDTFCFSYSSISVNGYRLLSTDFLVQVWLRQKYYTLQVQPDRGLNSWPPGHGQYISCPWNAGLNHWAIRDLPVSKQN